MATIYNRELDVNARNWLTEVATPVIPAGYVQHYHSHPDYDGIIHVIGDGSTAFNALRIYSDMRDGIVLIEGRKAFEPLEFSSLVVSSAGWYRIAKLTGSEAILGMCSIKAAVTGTAKVSGQEIEVGRYGTGGAKNNFIKMHPQTSIDGSESILGWRLGYEFGYATDAYVEVLFDVGTYSGTLHLSDNIDIPEKAGFRLIDPVAGGGSTYYIVAGGEQEYYSLLTSDSRVAWTYVSANTVRMTFLFDDIPFPNSASIALTYTQITLKDDTNVYTFDGSETLGAPVIHGNLVAVIVTKTGAFTGFINTSNTVFHSGIKAVLS